MNRKSFKNKLFFANGSAFRLRGSAALALLLAAVMLSLSLVGCRPAVDPNGGFRYDYKSYEEYLSFGKTTPLLDNIDERGYTWRKGDGAYHKDFSDKPDPNECYFVDAYLDSKTDDYYINISCQYNHIRSLAGRMRLLEFSTYAMTEDGTHSETHPEDIRMMNVNGITVSYCFVRDSGKDGIYPTYDAAFGVGGHEYNMTIWNVTSEKRAREIITEFVSRAA